MNIILFTSVYYNNIGNAFIDLGAEATTKMAVPKDLNLIKLSQCANFAASMDWKFRIREFPGVRLVWNNLMRNFAQNLHDKAYSIISTKNVFSAALIAKSDYFIIPGCVLTVPFFKIFGNLLEEKVRQGTKIIFLGVSGNHYTSEEVAYVGAWLKRLTPHALMFRDSVAYGAYKRYSKISYNGIDNVFFVNQIGLKRFNTTMDPYYVLNFDLKENNKYKIELETTILKDKNIIYTNHKPYPQSVISKEVKKDILVSDFPIDYLAIYRNVHTTYSDRVHACIPTLAFGNYARLYSKSPRKALFENVGLSDVSKKTVKLYGLDEYQNRQVEFLRMILQ